MTTRVPHPLLEAWATDLERQGFRVSRADLIRFAPIVVEAEQRGRRRWRAVGLAVRVLAWLLRL